ncbi:MAG: hypothetical protein HDR88_13230 [Bacteroides sp.]|nr:hypothetical protein [Bacteroides sp.]
MVASKPFHCVAVNAQSVNKSYFRYRFSDESLPVEVRARYADSIMLYFPKERNNLLRECAEMYFEYGDINKAATYINRRLAFGLEDAAVDEKCETMVLAAQIFMRRGNFIRATAVADSLLSIKKPDSLLYKEMEIYEMFFDMNAGNIATTGQFVSKAERLYEKTLKIRMDKKYTNMMRQLLTFLKLRRAWYTDSIDKVMEYAMMLDKTNISNRQRASIINTRGLIAMQLGDTQEAQQYFVDVIAMRPFSEYNLHALVNLIYVFNMEGKFSNALDTIDAYSEKLKIFNDNIIYCSLLKLKAEALAGIGNFKEAYMNLETAYDVSDSIFMKSSINRNIYDMDIANLNKTLQTTTEEKNTAVKTLYLIIGCLVIMIIVVGVLLLRIRKLKQQLSSVDTLQSEKISLMKEADQQKDTEMENLSRELVGKTMKVEHLEKIISEIEIIVGKKGAIATDKAQALRNLLKPIPMEEQTWQSFSYHFENVDKNFSLELQRRHPDLTPGEKRLISYIIMNLTSKEIAELTNKSIRSIDSARYRLSKKLGLENGTSLSAYLTSIANNSHGVNSGSNIVSETSEIDNAQLDNQNNKNENYSEENS